MKSKQRKKTTSEMIYLAKSLGIILVVIGHYHVPNIQPDYWLSIRKVFYYFHMPLFMILSGYLFGYNKTEIITKKAYFGFVKKKSSRLLIPYITITLISVGMKISAGFFFTLQHPIEVDAWQYILLNPMGGFATRLWFIYTLFIIFILYPLIKSLLKNELHMLFVLIILSLLQWPRAFCLNLVFSYLPYFVVGIIISRKILFEELSMHILIATVFVTSGLFALFYILLPENKTMFLLCKLTLGILGSVACIFIACGIARLKISRILVFFGLYSTSIYLLHTLFMGPIRIFCYQVLGLDKEYFIVTAIISCLIGLCIPALIEKYYFKRKPIISKYILGST